MQLLLHLATACAKVACFMAGSCLNAQYQRVPAAGGDLDKCVSRLRPSMQRKRKQRLKQFLEQHKLARH